MSKIEPKDFLYKKVVDKSVLYQGINIEQNHQDPFLSFCEDLKHHGTSLQTKILLDGEFFDVDLKNIDFDRKKHPNHKEIIQFRYSDKSSFSLKLQEIFYRTKAYVDPIQAAKKRGDKTPIIIPEELREYIVLSSTDFKNIFVMDCITLGAKS